MDKIFRRFLLPYFIILVITLIAFLVLYTHASRILENRLIGDRLANLQHVSVGLDRDLLSIVRTLNHATINPQLRSFATIREPYKGANVIRTLEAMNLLNDIRIGIDNPLLQRILIVHDYGDVVLFPMAAIHKDIFVGQYLSAGDASPEEWVQLILNGSHHARFIPAMYMRLGNTSYNKITYVIPISTFHREHSALVAFINNDVIHDTFTAISGSDGGISYIISTDGQIISHCIDGTDISNFPLPTGTEGILRFEAEGESYLMSYVRSQFLNWYYISIIRSGYALEELNAFRHIVVFIILLLFAVTIPFSIFISFRQKAPFVQLQNTIAVQTPLLQHAFIGDLLTGKITGNELNPNNNDLPQLDLSGALYMAVVVSGKETPLDVTQFALIHLIFKEFEKNALQPNIKQYHHTNLGRNETAMLFVCKDMALIKQVNSLISTLTDDLRAGGVSDIAIGVGTVYPNLTDVNKSYVEAVEAIQYYRVIDNERIHCLFAEMPQGNGLYFYPEEEEHRLMNLVRNGDTEAVRDILNQLCNSNFIGNRLPHNMLSAFINHLCQGILKIDRQSLFNDELVENVQGFCSVFHQLGDLEKLTRCTQLFITISESIKLYKQSRSHGIVQEIKARCETNFHDPNISLADFADQYNLSETYLSLQFKESTGENFYTHLQNLRLNKAIELLMSTQSTIHKINDSVGYSSYNTFAKAFKRKTGINAGDYRKVKKGE